MTANPTDRDQKPSATLPGTVEKIILLLTPACLKRRRLG